jgi:hypothetical protein
VPEAYVIRALTAHGSGDGADWHQTGRPFMKPVPGTGFKSDWALADLSSPVSWARLGMGQLRLVAEPVFVA